MSTVLILTKDLMIQSSASAAVREAGFRLRACGSVSRMLERLIEEAPVIGIFVDLQTPGLDLSELSDALGSGATPTTIAFAQHVEEQLLADAKFDGIDAVLTRGQFSHRLPQLVSQFAATQRTDG